MQSSASQSRQKIDANGHRWPLFTQLLVFGIVLHLLDIALALHFGFVWGHPERTALMIVVDLPITATMLCCLWRSIRNLRHVPV